MEQLMKKIAVSLAEKGFDMYHTADPKDIFLFKWINYRYIMVDDREEKDDQFLVIQFHPTDTFINLWIDKLYSSQHWTQDMGNGFIHKTIYSIEDWEAFLPVINMAMY